MINMLEDIDTVNIEKIGGKGKNLVYLLQEKFPVPAGFIVETTAYKKFFKENNLGGFINKILKTINFEEYNEIEKASQQIKEKIIEAQMSDELENKVVDKWVNLDKAPVAVRSSATAEDLENTSFAGQHDSFLNITNRQQLISKIKECWASLWNTRAIFYRHKNNIIQKENKISMAVIVQKMIKSQKAGILFTANPLNNHRGQFLINSSWGLGEAVVSGIVTPDRFVLSKNEGKVIEKDIFEKNVQVVYHKNGTRQTKVPEELISNPSLTSSELKELYNLAKDIDNYYKKPMDIEWAIKEGKCYLLQARAITGLYPLPDKISDPEKSGLELYFSFTRIAQGITNPMTPMGLEIQRLEMWATLINLGFATGKYPEAFKTAGGRVYWNITKLLRNPKHWDRVGGFLAEKDPVAEQVLLDFLDTNKKEITQKNEKINLSFKFFVFLAGFFKKVIGAIMQPDRAPERSIALVEKHIEGIKEKEKQAETIKEKLHLIEEIMKKSMKVMLYQCSYFFPGYLGLNFIEDQKEWLNDKKLLDQIIQALPHNPTSQMNFQLAEIACKLKENNERPHEDHSLIRNFLSEFGHRSNNELDVGCPNWQEDPEYIVGLINSYVEQNPKKRLQELKKQEREANNAINILTKKVREEKGIIASWKIKLACKYLRKTLGLRERPKFDQIRSFALIRNILQDIGQKLVDQGQLENINDVFYLNFSQILKGEGPYHKIVENQKSHLENFQEIKTIPRFIVNTGECLYDTDRQNNSNNELQGVPVSSGEYSGIVKVINDPKKAILQEGEILVTHSTDPSWTPLFLKAGALIMETGGAISHGGIVAREYGIPAVAGIEHISEKLRTGDCVEVNGNSGIVKISRRTSDDKKR